MKKFAFLFVSGFLGTAFAAKPSITVSSFSQDPVTRTFTVNYTLSGEPAVVTMGAETNGVALPETAFAAVTGDANRLMQPGSGRTLKWCPPAELGFGPFDAGEVKIALKAWPTNSPPDYMVIDLAFHDDASRIRYYTCKENLPCDPSDACYKTDYLVMRRIPAAGTTWRMGSPSTEPNRRLLAGAADNEEDTHYVKLTNDYYLAIYPTTTYQNFLLTDITSSSANYYWWQRDSENTARVEHGYDWPIGHVQQVFWRGYFHTDSCTVSNTVFKFWPRDGHAIDDWVAGGLKCPQCGKGYSNSNVGNQLRFYTMRKKYGLMFDFPTEAQWDFACRGGAGGEGPLYKVGDRTPEIDEIAWYVGNSSNVVYDAKLKQNVSYATPHPVGLKMPNNYGLYDMIGNISEWCIDWRWRPANSSNVIINDGLQKHMWHDIDKNSTQERLVRGANFSCPLGFCRAAFRAYTGPSNLNAKLGTADANCVLCGQIGYRIWLPCHAVK